MVTQGICVLTDGGGPLSGTVGSPDGALRSSGRQFRPCPRDPSWTDVSALTVLISPALAPRADPEDQERYAEYIEADLAEGLPFHRQSFDVATANMLDDCEPDGRAWIAEALKPEGRLLASLNNPYAGRGQRWTTTSGRLTQTFGTEQARYEVPFYYRTGTS